MTTDNDSRAIGRLEAQFESMQKQLDSLADMQKEALDESREGRRRIYESQDETRKETTQLKADIKKIGDQIAIDKPILDDISRWKERLYGMQILVTGVAATVGGSVVLFWKWISIKLGLQ